MIRVIGVQKVFSLLAMVLLLVSLIAYWFYTLKPDIKSNQRELSMNTSAVAEMTENLDDLIKGIERFKDQQKVFELVKALGFFDPQNRPEARKRLSAMQKESRLLSAKFSIKSAATEKSEKATAAGYKVLNTDIDLTLEAIEDKDIYNFIYLMNYGFPGQILITDLNIKRDIEVTQPVLRQIGLKESGPLVVAVVRLNWRTMVPDTSLAITINGGSDN